MITLAGVPVEKDERLPLSKIDAVSLHKDIHVVKREYWIDKYGMVWGYYDHIGYFNHKIYLCEKAFIKLKNADLSTNINEIF